MNKRWRCTWPTFHCSGLAEATPLAQHTHAPSPALTFRTCPGALYLAFRSAVVGEMKMVVNCSPIDVLSR